jgi:FKBP-type peptidyl-prolyl cis-trans isomerase 2
MWCTYTVEYHSAIKKSEMVSFAGKWMELEIIVLGKISQTERQVSHVHMQNLDLRKEKEQHKCK